jgi:drug/metabolite transporter (DMT)-like permease
MPWRHALVCGGLFVLYQAVMYLAVGLAADRRQVIENLTRRWARGAERGLVPVFLLASGAVLALARLARPETPVWTGRAAAELIYMAIGPALAAYVCWDAAMRTGRLTVVAPLSYATPLLSTLASGLYLGVRVGRGLWLACALVVAGAVVCRLAVREPPGDEAV